MSRTIETTVYKFDELSESAKQNGREWFTRQAFSDSNGLEHVYADADECAAILGIDIARRNSRNMGGGINTSPEIMFSGFWSQGDGACFEGTYRYKKGAAKAIRQHAPHDTELHRIADGLQKVQARNFYKLTASMAHSGHYVHSGCMSVSVEHADDRWRTVSDEADLRELMRDFADWIYSQLQREYDYQTSDEVVDENIRANGYEFTEAGEVI